VAAGAGLVLALGVMVGCSDDDDPAADDRPSDRADATSGPSTPSDGDSPSATTSPSETTSPGQPPTDRPSASDRPPRDDRPGDPSPDYDPPGDPSPGEASWPRFGAVYHGMWDMTWSDRAELLDKLTATGAKWVRLGVQWSGLQPDSAGSWNQWAIDKADRVIRQAVERGLKVSVTFLRTPGWANGGRAPEYLPSDPATYARALEWLAHRYRDQVSSWEIYNEPNNTNHLRSSVGEYVRLLCAAYPAAHRGDPSTRVVFGGTSGVDYEYIDAAYDLGAGDCFDVLAVHPYNGEYSPVMQARSDHRWWWRNIELVRRVMRQHGDLETPVWFTEYGWSTHPDTAATPSWERGVTYEQQARYAVQLLRITKREYPYVERVAWYAARDETHSSVENNNFGLFTIDLQPKPIVAELHAFLTNN
jgi:polysaccharide biosynthesis protein PslG